MLTVILQWVSEGILLNAENRKIGIAIGGFAIAALLLGGCASESSGASSATVTDSTSSESTDAQVHGPRSSDAITDSRGIATVSIDGRTFEFDLRMCSVYDGGEALVSGPGSEVGSDVASHLDGDSVTFEDGEFRIDIGADGPFQSTDEFLSIGSSLGGSFLLADDGSGYVVTGHAWDRSGTDLGVGTMRFNCN